MNFSRDIVTTKFVVYDESPLLKKLVYDELSKDAGIEILDIFKNYIDFKQYLYSLSRVVDGVIINLLLDKDNKKDLINIILDLKWYTANFIIIANINPDRLKMAQQVLGISNIVFIDYFDKLDLKNISSIKERVNREVYNIKNSRIKRRLFHTSKAVVIAASTGGPKTLEYIFRNLETKIEMPIFIVQHMVNGYTKQFADRLSKVCSYKICEGIDGQIAQNNVVYIAPSGYHMEVKSHNMISLNVNEPINNVRPSADVLFSSASKVYKEGLLGIVLTGMGRDAADGIKVIKLHGGRTIAQAQSSSVVFGMPKAAIETGMVDKVLSTDDIMFEMLKHAGKL